MGTLKDEIQQWIDNGYDYFTGILLLRKYGNKRAMVKFLEKGEPNESKLEHLKYNLLKLAKELQVSPEVVIEDISLRPDDTEIEIQKQKKYPEEVVKLKAIKAKIYTDRALLHKKLIEVGTSNDPESIEKRKQLRDAIIRLTDEFKATDAKIQSIFDTLSGKVSNNTVVAGKTDSPDDLKPENAITPAAVIELQKEFDNNIAYISKNKNNTKPAIQQKVQERKERNEEIKKLLEDVK